MEFKKYRLYCATDGWQNVIATSEPTVCPIGGHGNHTIKESSIILVFDKLILDDGSYKDLTLDEYKQLKCNSIDQRTAELIELGYTYQGKQFSLSQNAQINILALDEVRNDPAITYPIEYNTIDDLDNYFVVDATDVHNMYLTALATKKGLVDSGTLIKDSIRACTTEAEVDSIIDNR